MPSNAGQPKFWPGPVQTFKSSQVLYPTSPMYHTPGLPSDRRWLPVSGLNVIRHGLRNPSAQTRDRAARGLAES